jgi:hypothetical protein
MFTGYVPSGHDYPVIGDVASNYTYVDELVRSMTAYSPAQRVQSIAAVKESLLARGNHFVALQRLEAVRNEVVSASEPNDPLHGQDVRLTGSVDYDPGSSQLRIGLSPEPPRSWWNAMGQLTVTHYFGSASPQNVGWSNGQALLIVPSPQAPQVLEMFKDWVARTNEKHRVMLREAAQRDMDGKLRDLERRRKLEEERVRVLQQLQGVQLR